MTTTNKNIYIIGMLLIISLFGFSAAFAGSVEGRIQGLQCAVTTKLCPVDSRDPRVSAERNFVLQLGNDSYYFIPNISRNDLAPYVTSKARISGEENSEYKSIRADKLEVFMDGQWKTAWSQEMQDTERRLQAGG